MVPSGCYVSFSVCEIRWYIRCHRQIKAGRSDQLVLRRDISEFRTCEQLLNILDQLWFSLLPAWIASTTLNIFGFPFSFVLSCLFTIISCLLVEQSFWYRYLNNTKCYLLKTLNIAMFELAPRSNSFVLNPEQK